MKWWFLCHLRQNSYWGNLSLNFFFVKKNESVKLYSMVPRPGLNPAKSKHLRYMVKAAGCLWTKKRSRTGSQRQRVAGRRHQVSAPQVVVRRRHPEGRERRRVHVNDRKSRTRRGTPSAIRHCPRKNPAPLIKLGSQLPEGVDSSRKTWYSDPFF